ncbi:MAG: nucleotidyltransferase family protein [Nitrospiria bacterium]
MKISSKEEIVTYLKNKKGFLYERFGVTSMGVFGSFVRDEQTSSSDIDMVIEMERGRKSIHSFLQLKRFLENELGRKVDLGFENALKPVIREKLKRRIIYV